MWYQCSCDTKSLDNFLEDRRTYIKRIRKCEEEEEEEEEKNNKKKKKKRKRKKIPHQLTRV
jgi:hypothetical protein